MTWARGKVGRAPCSSARGAESRSSGLLRARLESIFQAVPKQIRISNNHTQSLFSIAQSSRRRRGRPAPTRGRRWRRDERVSGTASTAQRPSAYGSRRPRPRNAALRDGRRRQRRRPRRRMSMASLFGLRRLDGWNDDPQVAEKAQQQCIN